MFILKALETPQKGIGVLVAKRFKISRTAASKYLKRLERDGLVSAEGLTASRRYKLRKLLERKFLIPVTPDLEEHQVWMNQILPLLKNLPRNVEQICHYGFTEMLNNVIDHSGADSSFVTLAQTATSVTITVLDKGIGIFEKIKRDFNLDDSREALIELSKGKLTSDRARHSGEGIFFTSRMFNSFSIVSGDLTYLRSLRLEGDWLVETRVGETPTQGTFVSMVIELDANWTSKEIFEKYQNDDFAFAKTHVPISLARYGNENLVSRSQAKRVLARFDKFEEVLLDFEGIEEIGQAFADEIFRVFATAHPNTKVIAINTSEQIGRMIAHAKAANPSSPG